MTLVAGVDSSTQSCKVVVIDAATGRLVRSGRAPHPDGTEVDPAAWMLLLLSSGQWWADSFQDGGRSSFEVGVGAGADLESS